MVQAVARLDRVAQGQVVRADDIGPVQGDEKRALHCPRADPVSADHPVSLCDQGILMDQAAKPVPAQNAYTGHFDRRMLASGGRLLLQ